MRRFRFLIIILTAAALLPLAAPVSGVALTPGLAVAPASGAAPASGLAAPPQELTLSRDSAQVFLLTFGPGSAVWERFGHNALWVHDPSTGSDMAYHYGLFDMSETGFLTRFLQGRMHYSMGEADAGLLMDFYLRQGRDVYVQELALTPEQIEELDTFLRWNMQPENRRYRYDYFRDNCSTRLRDALDRVLDGQLEGELASRPTPVTWRSEALDLTGEDAILTTALDIGLGPLADRDITRWDLAYIPMRLRDDLRSFAIRRDGATMPMVRSERYIEAPTGAASGGEPGAGGERAVRGEPAPPDVGRILGHLLAGLLFGGALAGAGHAAGTSRGGAGRAGAWFLGLAGGAWGLVAGLLGVTLVGLWLFTDHEFAYRNENLLQMNPLALAMVVLAPMAALRGKGAVAAAVVAAVVTALSLLGLLLHPLPLTGQANLAIVALALPTQAGLLYGVGALWRRGTEATTVTAVPEGTS